MNFLTPAFLAGLAALAIPVIIHLINREKRVVVQFPSLMFLHKIPYRSIRRQKLRHLLLLLLRCLALLLFVAAFARPWFERSKHAGAGSSGAREVVILVDRSYSMGYGDRWSKALDKAREVVRAISANDRATIVFFANEPSAATDPTADRARLENALKTAKLSSEATRYAPAIKFASDIVGGSNLPRKDIILISDFQKAGWAKREELALPPGVELHAIDVSAKPGTDAAVIGVTTDRTRDTTRARIIVTARVANLGAAPRTLDAVLDLGGRAVESKHLTVAANSAEQVRFSPVAVPATATRGVVSITKDSLAADDQFFFTVAPDEAVSRAGDRAVVGAGESKPLPADGALDRGQAALQSGRPHAGVGQGGRPRSTLADHPQRGRAPRRRDWRENAGDDRRRRRAARRSRGAECRPLAGGMAISASGEFRTHHRPDARRGRHDRRGGLRESRLRDLQRSPKRRLFFSARLSLSGTQSLWRLGRHRQVR